MRRRPRSSLKPVLIFVAGFLLWSSAAVLWPLRAEAYESPPSSYRTLTGADRYETSILVSQQAFPQGAPAVVLVRGDNFPDALAATSLAASYGGPVVLTPASGLIPAVAAELQRLGPEKVFFVGLPDTVLPGLAAALPGADVVKLVGRDRYHTAALVAGALEERLGSVTDVVLVSGDRFPDALSVAPLAADRGWAVLLTPQSGPLPASTAAAIEGLGADRALVVGTRVKPPASVGEVVYIVGADRFHTNVLVAEYGRSLGSSYGHLGLATGENYPDALVAGGFLALDRGLLLLVGPGGLAPAAKNALAAARTKVADVDMIGLSTAKASVLLSQMGATATVTGVRTSTSLDATRVVVDLSGPPSEVRMRVLPGGELQVDIGSVLVVGGEPAAALDTPEVDTIDVHTAEVMGAKTRVRLDLGRFQRYQVKRVPRAGGTPDQVVIDVLGRLDGPAGDGGPLVALDAGHGGTDPGAVGVTDTYEKNVNLAVVKKLDTLLRAAGLRTVLTRASDVTTTLSSRTTTANEVPASLFVSVHCNAASDPAVSGIETFYRGSADVEVSEEGRLLAIAIQQSLVAALGARDRGARTHWVNLYVLVNTDMTAVLTELGFLTNAAEEAKLKDAAYQDRAAQALRDGILRYLGWADRAD